MALALECHLVIDCHTPARPAHAQKTFPGRARRPRAADHGRDLPARRGLGGRGPCPASRSALLFRRPHDDPRARTERAPHAPAGGHPLCLSPGPFPGNGAPLGAQAPGANLFLRLGDRRRRRHPQFVGRRAPRRRSRTARRVDPRGAAEREIAMTRWFIDLLASDPVVLFLADVVLKATLLLCLAAIAAVLLRRASAAVRHRIWAVVLGTLVIL